MPGGVWVRGDDRAGQIGTRGLTAGHGAQGLQSGGIRGVFWSVAVQTAWSWFPARRFPVGVRPLVRPTAFVVLAVTAAACLLASCATDSPEPRPPIRIARQAAGAIAPAIQTLTRAEPVPAGDGSIGLAGQWDFRFDPDGVGFIEGWFHPGAGGFDARVAVPGCFNTAASGLAGQYGAAWHRTRFTVPSDWGPSRGAVLRFDGIALRARVWLNGQYLGQQLYPYIPFELDVSPALAVGGENILVVEVDNRPLPGALPDSNWRAWPPAGGILRGVRLVPRQPVDIHAAWLDTRHLEGNEWRASAVAQVSNPGDEPLPAEVVFRLRDGAGNVVWTGWESMELAPGTNAVRASGRVGGVMPWSPDSPTLYELTTVLKAAGDSRTRSVRTGFRDFAVDGPRLLLNGEPLALRGVSWREDDARRGPAVTADDIRRDLEDIRALGANTVFVPFHPAHPAFYAACDELGLIATVEFPVWRTGVALLGDTTFFDDWFRPHVESTVLAYRHHPSVALWSLGREFRADQEEAAWFVKSAAELLRSLDPGRGVTFVTGAGSADRCWPFVDVVVVDADLAARQASLYELGALIDGWHRQAPGKPLVVTGVGAPAVPGRRGDQTLRMLEPDFTEDYQAKALSAMLEQTYDRRRRPYVAGAVVWLYNDFPSNQLLGLEQSGVADGMEYSGIVSRERRRKAGFEVVANVFAALQATASDHLNGRAGNGAGPDTPGGTAP